MVGNPNQSDYRCVCKGCVQGLHAQGLHARVAHAEVAHKGCTQGLHMQGLCMQGLRARVACAGVACARVVCARWCGHSTNQITQELHTRVAHTRVEGTLSQSDYTGVACKGGGDTQTIRLHRVVHKGCECKGGGDTQPIRLHRDYVQGWRGHSANQITQGLCTRVVFTGVVHAEVVGTLSQSDYTGIACKGGGDTQTIRLHSSCAQGLCMQGWWGHSANQITQGLRTRVACARVVWTLSQSDYTGVVHKGCVHRGCACRGGGDTQPIRLHRDYAQGLHVQGWWGHSANQITQGLRARVEGTLSQSDYTGVACKGCTQGLRVQLVHHCFSLVTVGCP